MMMHILKSLLKESKGSFLKETIGNADLYKAVLNKTVTTQE